MATMSRCASADEAVDRSSTSSAVADARKADAPKYVLHDSTVSSKLYIGKKIVACVFEGTAALRQPCCSDDSCECGGGLQSFEKG